MRDKTQPIPETYLHVLECYSGEEWIVPLGDNDSLDLETQLDRWIAQEFCGELERDGEVMPRLEGNYYARIMTGNPPESVCCWQGGGFYLKNINE